MSDHTSKVATPELTQQVRKMAQSAGWPHEAISALEVVESGGDISVRVADEATELVNSIEYGTSEVSPNPVIRSFNSQVPELLQEHLHKALKLHGQNFLEEL